MDYFNKGNYYTHISNIVDIIVTHSNECRKKLLSGKSERKERRGGFSSCDSSAGLPVELWRCE